MKAIIRVIYAHILGHLETRLISDRVVGTVNRPSRYCGRVLISGQSKITGETVPIAAFTGLLGLQTAPYSPLRTLHLGDALALEMRLPTIRNKPLVVVSGGTSLYTYCKALEHATPDRSPIQQFLFRRTSLTLTKT